MPTGRRRAWGAVTALAVVAACLLIPAGASAGKHKRQHHARAQRINVDQLRGAMLTPNWSVAGTPFAMTGTQQYMEVKNVCHMGGDLVRFSVDWSQLQPRDVDQAYLGRIDQMMNWASACGIKVILDLVGSPCWAIAPAPCRGNSWIFTPPRGGAFEAITRFLLARYPSLYALEVWNEPNYAFWHGTPDQYGALVTEALTARNSLGSRTRILAGALLLDGFNYLPGLSYLEELYQAGMRGEDGISIHPYSMGCEYNVTCGIFMNPGPYGTPFRAAIKAAHEVMLRYGDRAPIYLTEFGFATCPAHPSCVPEPTAAVWLARSFQIAARIPYVAGLTAFSMRDYAPPSDADPLWDMRSGIVRQDLSPKPAFPVLRSVLSRLAAKARHRKPRRHLQGGRR
jgi:hypothetical protein